ncbi:hypothetical protein OAA06_01855 [bacterium]|nr:hypothetical protein [bacterium]
MIYFNTVKLYLLLILFSTSIISCEKEKEKEILGDWIQAKSLNIDGFYGGVVFQIGNETYVGTGYNDNEQFRSSDFYMTIDGISWTQVASLPEGVLKRDEAVAFSVDGKGYVGLGRGLINEGTPLAEYIDLIDFYEYSPETNTWRQVADFPGIARRGAIAFSLGGKGYVGGGYTSENKTTKTFYEYDPINDEWTERSPILGSQSNTYASCFVINEEAFVVGGISDDGVMSNELVKYNSKTNSWSELNKVTNTHVDKSFDNKYTIPRYNAASFAINGKGYLVGGRGLTSISNEVWEYDPVKDRWIEKTSFEGNLRYGAVGYSIGNYGYMGTGSNGLYSFSDFWRFDPTVEYNKLW